MSSDPLARENSAKNTSNQQHVRALVVSYKDQFRYRVMPLWTLPPKAWHGSRHPQNQQIEEKGGRITLTFSPNLPFIHRQLQYLSDSKSLDLDKSSLPTPLMLLHLLSITIMSKVYGGIEMMINMVVQEAIACLPL